MGQRTPRPSTIRHVVRRRASSPNCLRHDFSVKPGIKAPGWSVHARVATAGAAFFERQRECPQGALETRPLSDDDALAWYVA
jgi:hypothetical protein